MTAIIAAICDEGRTIITVSDRLIVDPGSGIAHEPETPKVVEFPRNSVVMTAGSAVAADVLLTARRYLEAPDAAENGILPGVEGVVQCVKCALSAVTWQGVCDKILREYLGYSNGELWQQQRANLEPGLAERIDAAIANFRLGVTYIVAGVDTEAHIFVVSDQFADGCFDTVGYTCQGACPLLGAQAFTQANYGPVFTFGGALPIALAAKKEMEKTLFVGKQTDIRKITAAGIETVNEQGVVVTGK